MVTTLEIKELSNPILPISVGKAYVAQSKHTSFYHINISDIETCLYKVQYLLDKSNYINNNSSKNESFTLLTSHKFKQTADYLQRILSNVEIFHKPTKVKRGLINIVGKVNKWLFGTLDSDDEDRFNNYFNTILQNEQKAQDDLKSEHTVLTSVVETYNVQLKKLTKNQDLLLDKINQLRDMEYNIGNALYMSLILDNIIFQLNTVNQLVSNIETAISFAHVNTMHNSILNPSQLRKLISDLHSLYKSDNLPKFNELINYYKYLSVQVMIKENIILFSIHTPITGPNQFTLYKIFPIPVHNQTISVADPYILLTKEEYWTAQEECPQLENVFICQQEALSREASCVFKLITTTVNECPLVDIYFKRTTVHRLNGKEILVIPVNETIIKSTCKKGLYSLRNPSIITIPECAIKIGHRVYEKETSSDLRFIVDLPDFSYTEQSTAIPKLQLDEVNIEELNKARKILDSVKFHFLNEPTQFSPTYWTLFALILGILILAALIYLWRTLRQRRKSRRTPSSNDIDLPLDERKNKEPLFSELTEGGVM